MNLVLNQQDVARARSGDREAFGALYDAVAPELYKVALYTLRSPEDAEDVVSETFMEAYKGIGGLREDSSFRPWIMRILSIRCKRKIGGYVKEKGNIDIDEYIEEGIPDRSARRAEVLEALSRLTAGEREIVILSAMQGYTMREIAEILQLPQGTVSSKLHRALKKLRGMLTE